MKYLKEIREKWPQDINKTDTWKRKVGKILKDQPEEM